MITLDQVLLLKEKVEAAVEKISSLKEKISSLESENASLREKCLGLEKEVSDKASQVSTMELDQERIEKSILDTLYRLDCIENGLLGNQDVTSSNQKNISLDSEIKETHTRDVVSKPASFEKEAEEKAKKEEISPISEMISQKPVPSSEETRVSEDESDLNGQFDIF